MDASNNANVIKVTSLGNLSGLSYGKYVALHDTSKYAVKKDKEPKVIYKTCQMAFTPPKLKDGSYSTWRSRCKACIEKSKEKAEEKSNAERVSICR